MEGWKGVLPNGVSIFYFIKIWLHGGVGRGGSWEPIGSPAFSIEDAHAERKRLWEFPLFANDRLTIWKFEQVISVSKCGTISEN